MRDPGTLNQGTAVLKPEQATNWALGGEFAPTTFLQGLDIQATWYKIKITSVLQGFGNPTSNYQSGDFMRIFGLYNSYAERQVRLGLRYSF